jgi:hypothetical protein
MVKDRVNVAGSIGTAVHERVIEAAADQSQFWGESASPQFEVDGWDVVCMFTYWGRATGKIGSQYDLGEPEKISEFEGNFESEHRVLIELKPMMSDDYPTVMRQIMSRPSKLDGHRFLVVRQVSFQHVTWEQVQAIFETASITALLESDIAP